MADAAHEKDGDVDFIDVVDPRLARRGPASVLAAAIKGGVLAGFAVANTVSELAKGGRKLDFVGMPSAELMPLVSRLAGSALSLKGMPQGKSATRSLTHALHAAGVAEENSLSDIDYAGLIIAIAFQCSQMQGPDGKGVDLEALVWARTKVLQSG
jgi:hypothetical protein